jgi:hypothetical protein
MTGISHDDVIQNFNLQQQAGTNQIAGRCECPRRTNKTISLRLHD